MFSKAHRLYQRMGGFVIVIRYQAGRLVCAHIPPESLFVSGQVNQPALPVILQQYATSLAQGNFVISIRGALYGRMQQRGVRHQKHRPGTSKIYAMD